MISACGFRCRKPHARWPGTIDSGGETLRIAAISCGNGLPPHIRQAGHVAKKHHYEAFGPGLLR
jgi:hypothetical protein